jgi:hypothetical protein
MDGAGLDRLTLVATSAWIVPVAGSADEGMPADDVRAARHPLAAQRGLLDRLLDRAGGTLPGQAWIRRDTLSAEGEWQVGEFVPGLDSPPLVDELNGSLEDTLRTVSGDGAGTGAGGDGLHAVIGRFRYRIFIDRSRFEALVEDLVLSAELQRVDLHPEIRYVSFDFRLYQTRDKLRWHISVLVDTHLPQAPGNRPAELTNDTTAGLRWNGGQRLAYAKAARAAEALLGEYFEHATFWCTTAFTCRRTSGWCGRTGHGATRSTTSPATTRCPRWPARSCSPATSVTTRCQRPCSTASS